MDHTNPHAIQHITGRKSDGQRTTASMPASEKARYVAGLGGNKFREIFTSAMRDVVPRPGLSRSMAVRLVLDKALDEVQASAQTAAQL